MDYDVYGFPADSIERLRDLVGEHLQVCFQRHESAYLGGDYFLSGDLQGEHFLLRRNRGLGPPDELAEPEFAEYGLLLEVNATSRSDLLKSALEAIPGLTLIRRRTLPDR